MTRFELIAPDADNDGRRAPGPGRVSYRDFARRAIVAAFGGATAARSRGYWHSPDSGRDFDDPVTVWTIDAPADAALTVTDTARLIANYARQESVYCTAVDAEGFRRAFVAQDGAGAVDLLPGFAREGAPA